MSSPIKQYWFLSRCHLIFWRQTIEHPCCIIAKIILGYDINRQVKDIILKLKNIVYICDINNTGIGDNIVINTCNSHYGKTVWYNINMQQWEVLSEYTSPLRWLHCDVIIRTCDNERFYLNIQSHCGGYIVML